MNTTSDETVLSMDSTIMGDEAISVKSVNPRGRVFKALMESENKIQSCLTYAQHQFVVVKTEMIIHSYLLNGWLM